MSKDAPGRGTETEGAAAPHGEGGQTGGNQAAPGKVKTAQPFADDVTDEPYNQMGGAPKPRPDQVDNPAMRDESNKTTQRQE